MSGEVQARTLASKSFPRDLLKNEFSFLRPLEETDARITFQWRTSARSNLLHRGAETVAEQTEWIRSRPNEELNFMICCSCGRDVGMISLVNITSERGTAEPARLLVDRKYSSSGFAVSAIDNLYRLAFAHLDLNMMFGKVATVNSRMIRWQEKFGMEIIGESEEKVDLNGATSTLVFMKLSRTRYDVVTVPEIDRFFSVLRGRTRSKACPCSDQ